jgi:hypothetical protein
MQRQYYESEGNVDTEGSGIGQTYSTPNGGNDTEFQAMQRGAIQSAPQPSSRNQGMPPIQIPWLQSAPGFNDRLSQYEQLGSMVTGLPSQTKPAPTSLDLGDGNLVSGFDPNWLNTQVNAASANGATLGGGGGGGRGNSKKPGSAGEIPLDYGGGGNNFGNAGFMDGAAAGAGAGMFAPI